jgi:hypothetical protein
MYNYVPTLSSQNGESVEDLSGFTSHSRFSYSKSPTISHTGLSLNPSHNTSQGSLHSLNLNGNTHSNSFRSENSREIQEKDLIFLHSKDQVCADTVFLMYVYRYVNKYKHVHRLTYLCSKSI